MKIITDIAYSTLHDQKLDVYLPDRESFPVFVYFHGGGITGGDKARQKTALECIAERGIAVVSANYRLYSSAKYPDFIEDAAEAVAWVFKNIGSYGKTTGIFVGGSSAGGYISQMLCFDKKWLARHDIRPCDISGFVHDAGQPTCHFNVLRERGIDSRRVIVDESAPLYHVGEDGEYPPMLIIVSDDDMQNRYEQTMLLVSTLGHFGFSDRVQLKIMHGKHCEYLGVADENGENLFGKVVAPFILG